MRGAAPSVRSVPGIASAAKVAPPPCCTTYIDLYVPTGPHEDSTHTCQGGSQENGRTCALWKIRVDLDSMTIHGVEEYLQGDSNTGIVQPAISWDDKYIAYVLRDFDAKATSERARIHVRDLTLPTSASAWDVIDSSGAEYDVFGARGAAFKDNSDYFPQFPVWEGPRTKTSGIADVALLWYNLGNDIIVQESGHWLTKSDLLLNSVGRAGVGKKLPNNTDPQVEAADRPKSGDRPITEFAFKNLGITNVAGKSTQFVSFGTTTDGQQQQPIVHPVTQHAFDATPGDLEYFTLPSNFTKGCHHPAWSPSGDTIACWGSGVDQAMPDGTGRQVVTAHRFSKSMDASGYWKWSWQGTLFPTPTFAKLNADLGNILPASTFRVTFHYPQYVYDEEHALVTMIVTDQPGNVLTCRAVLVYFTGVAADTIFLDITGAVEEAVRRDDPEDEREYRSVFGTATHSRQQ